MTRGIRSAAHMIMQTGVDSPTSLRLCGKYPVQPRSPWHRDDLTIIEAEGSGMS